MPHCVKSWGCRWIRRNYSPTQAELCGFPEDLSVDMIKIKIADLFAAVGQPIVVPAVI